MPRAPEDIDGENATEWARVSALEVWGGRLSKWILWKKSSGEEATVGRKTDRAGDISVYDGDHARVWG